MRALIDSRDGRISQLVDDNGEFEVAVPFYWGDVPDVALQGDTLTATGELQKAVAPPTGDGMIVSTFQWTRGEGLPAHAHGDRGHTTDVLRGSITVVRDGAIETYTAGQTTSFIVNSVHSLTALEDNTVVVNITDL